MPRNSVGTMSLPAGQPVVTGTTIDATVFNALTSDLATELTDSLDRSGKGTMLAPLALAAGTDVLPGLAFALDGTTGIYRDTDGSLVITSGGDLARFAQAAITIGVPLVLTAQAPSLQTPTPGANWTISTGGKYWKNQFREVWVKGQWTATSNSAANLFVLASGFLPLETRRFNVVRSRSGAFTSQTVFVDTSGNVTPDPSVQTGDIYFLDAIRFLAEA